MVEDQHRHKHRIKNKGQNDFENYFFKLINKSVFRKTMKNVRNHSDIKLVTTDKRRNNLVSEPNYHTTKDFLKENQV